MTEDIRQAAPRLGDNINYQIRAYLKLIAEGYEFKDKLVIFVYLLCAPIRLISKLSGHPFRRRYIRDVKIENSDGFFFCGQSFVSSRNVCTETEKVLRGLFEINRGNFVDIGAHIGKYTIPLGRKLGNLGNVIAVEPDPNNFKLLSANVDINGLDNVLLQNIACSNKDSETIFYVNDDCPTLGSIYFPTGSKEIMVATMKLDTLLFRLGIEQVSLIKIDVEGAETDVIAGAQQTLAKSHPKLIFEAYNQIHLRQIENILSNFDYKIRKVNDKDYVAL